MPHRSLGSFHTLRAPCSVLALTACEERGTHRPERGGAVLPNYLQAPKNFPPPFSTTGNFSCDRRFGVSLEMTRNILRNYLAIVVVVVIPRSFCLSLDLTFPSSGEISRDLATLAGAGRGPARRVLEPGRAGPGIVLCPAAGLQPRGRLEWWLVAARSWRSASDSASASV